MGFLENKIDLADGENLAPDPERVAAIRQMLVPEFCHLGHPWNERQRWEWLKTSPIGIRILAEAKRAVALNPRPMVTDELYQMCLEKEGQAEFRTIAHEKGIRMSLLPFALCIDPDQDILGIIERDIDDLLDLTSWIHPANDDQGLAFAGQVPFNDLASLHNATNIVAARFLIGDRLGRDRCRRIATETTRRVLDPFRERIESGKDVYWWICHDNNWNSVCLASVLSCALALSDDLDDRAWYLAVVEAQIRNSVRGFSESGFYTEGVAYWGYGFGHFVQAAELVRAATGGKLDWLAEGKVARTSRYGHRMEIQDGVYPNFADCRSDVEKEVWLANWPNNRIDPGRAERCIGESIDVLEGFRFQFPLALLLVLFYQEHPAWCWEVAATRKPREWFEDVQFLICRPRPENPIRLAATFKGGHNGVSHNHNDLGTFSVLVDDQNLLVDPGAEIYTGRTFGPLRYESDLLNSYGHPVPVVAGQLQGPDRLEYSDGFGSEFHTTIVETEFSHEMDRVVLDLAGAYRVEQLTKLSREFRYHRVGIGRVEVIDEFEFSEPADFETALITYGDWEINSDGSITVSGGGQAIRVVVTSNTSLVFDSTIIQESSTPNRLAWRLVDPARTGRITFSIEVHD